jgi:hypothetical protein
MTDHQLLDGGKFPELGKHLLKTLATAVIMGVGLELGRDVYRWLKRRGERGRDPAPEKKPDDVEPIGDEAQT